MVSSSNRLCSCSFHCFPKDALVRSERVSERRITGKPSSIGKLERHPWHCKIPETISAFCSRAFQGERAAAQSGQRIKRSKLAFMRALRRNPGRPGGMLLSTMPVLDGPGNVRLEWTGNETESGLNPQSETANQRGQARREKCTN